MAFKGLSDALKAGYRLVNKKTDKDVSGYGYFGYTYENEQGERSETVMFRKDNDKWPTARPMYPPKDK